MNTCAAHQQAIRAEDWQQDPGSRRRGYTDERIGPKVIRFSRRTEYSKRLHLENYADAVTKRTRGTSMDRIRCSGYCPTSPPTSVTTTHEPATES
jgi:hypothetical protein